MFSLTKVCFCTTYVRLEESDCYLFSYITFHLSLTVKIFEMTHLVTQRIIYHFHSSKLYVYVGFQTYICYALMWLHQRGLLPVILGVRG